MTLFQARFIQWLTLNGASQRATVGNYFARYNFNGTQKTYKEEYLGFGENQLDGIFLREEAVKVLKKHNIEPYFEVAGTDIEDYDVFHKKLKDYGRFS